MRIPWRKSTRKSRRKQLLSYWYTVMKPTPAWMEKLGGYITFLIGITLIWLSIKSVAVWNYSSWLPGLLLAISGCGTCRLLRPSSPRTERSNWESARADHSLKFSKFDTEYDAIIKTAYEENPISETPANKCGRKKKSRVLNLICRPDNYKESVCLFIKHSITIRWNAIWKW